MLAGAPAPDQTAEDAVSLVGSLEDLGLGEILQIIDLSAKSGVLWIRSPEGKARLFFEAGRIRGVLLEDEPGPGAALPEPSDPDREALLLERVQSAAFRALSWRRGEFRFEIGELDPRPEEDVWLLAEGLNAQALLLEGARQHDESGGTEIQLAFLAENEEGGPGGFEEGTVRAAETSENGAEATDPEPREAGAEHAKPTETAPTAKTPAVAGRDESEPALAPPPPIVAVDTDLTTLEWIKTSVAGHCARVHLFQRSEEAVARIRQYVLRGELPLVLLTDATPPDPLTGARNWADITDRLRAQIPTLAVLLLAPDGVAAQAPSHAQPTVTAPRPDPTTLSDPRAEERRAAYAAQLQEAIRVVRAAGERRPHADPWRGDWREIRDRLRHAASREEVWNEVLDFVARGFSRVALFAIHADEAAAVAERVWDERGVIRARALSGPTLSLEDSGWLRKLAETRATLRAGPSDPGDRALVHGLGGGDPETAFLAPIERCAELAAVVYADQAGTADPLPDTRALEPVLKEAGLALERLPAQPWTG